MKSPLKYYGSKTRLAPWIVSHMTPHRLYVEPFAGSAAVLFSKPPSHYEILNDINGEVVNFFRVLRDDGESLMSSLELTPYSRDEYYASEDGYADAGASNVERARRFMVSACMGFNGVPGKRIGFSVSRLVRYRNAVTFSRRVDRLPEIIERLRGVEIENVDALVLLDRCDHRDATVYVDPPYLGETRIDANRYVHEAADAEFHQRLLNRLDSFSGEVVLSGYDSAMYSDMLNMDRWAVAEKDVQCATSSSSQRRIEMLWIKRREQA